VTDRGVHWGLSLPNRGLLFGGVSVEELLALARLAEDSSFFGSVWIGDSLLDRPRVNSIPLLGAIAAVTRRVKIGVSCFASFVVHHPIELAIQWASLDILSGGRTIWVPCLGGGMARELDPFGVKRSDRVVRLEEMLRLIKRFWIEDEVDHEGRFFSFKGVGVEPKPVQRPHPPIWYAVTPDDTKLSPQAVDRALMRAVELADGWQGADTDAAHIGRLRRRVQELARQHNPGGDPFPCSVPVHITIDDSKERAWDASRWFFDQYYPEDFRTGRGPIPDEFIQKFHTWGPAEECARGLLNFVRAGCPTILVRFAARDQTRQLYRFLSDVAPILQDAAPNPDSAL